MGVSVFALKPFIVLHFVIDIALHPGTFNVVGKWVQPVCLVGIHILQACVCSQLVAIVDGFFFVAKSHLSLAFMGYMMTS